MMNCNVAGLPHLLDRYVVSHIHRRHPFGFNHPINRHILENGPRDAATECYWSLSPEYLFFFPPPDVLSGHSRTSALGTASSTTLPRLYDHRPCAVPLFLRPFFTPVFMVNWPVPDDVAELVADTIILFLLFSIFLFPRLPCPPPPPK